MTTSRINLLNGYVTRHVSGKPLPAVVRYGEYEVPMLNWLDSFQFDRTPFSTDLASRLGLQSSPPLTCEAALTLKGRIS